MKKEAKTDQAIWFCACRPQFLSFVIALLVDIHPSIHPCTDHSITVSSPRAPPTDDDDDDDDDDDGHDAAVVAMAALAAAAAAVGAVEG